MSQVGVEGARRQVAVEEVDRGAHAHDRRLVVADLQAVRVLRAADRNVGLPLGEAALEVDNEQIERLALPLVDRERPRERERHLRALECTAAEESAMAHTLEFTELVRNWGGRSNGAWQQQWRCTQWRPSFES